MNFKKSSLAFSNIHGRFDCQFDSSMAAALKDATLTDDPIPLM